jgi:tetratricopeptide (TPR) repeat protein
MRIKAVAVMALFLAAPCFPQSTPDTRQQAESHARQAQEFLKANRPDLAAGEFGAILTLDPDNVEARANLGVVLSLQGEYAKAATELRAALEIRPSLWNIQVLLGMCEKRIGQAASAQADLEKAFPQLQEEKLRVQAGMELIEIYYGAGELDKAAGIAGILRQIRPTDADILYTAHRIYSDLADESMLSVAMSAPKSARMHQMMAQEMAREGDTEGAIAHYREALKIDPRASGLHFELAELLSGSSAASAKAEAEKEYRAALANNPFDEKSECRLGEIGFRAADLKDALAHYSRAVDLQPNDADAALGLGNTLAAMHQLDKAQLLLERAAKLEPFSSVIHYRLASVYREMGRTTDANRELAEFKRVREMKERLAEIYREMRRKPAKEERTDPDIPK